MRVDPDHWERKAEQARRNREALQHPHVAGVIRRLMAERDAALLALSNATGHEATIVWRNQEWPDIEYDDIT